MIAAMSDVGEGFKNNTVFMPQMLVAAKTMQAGLEILKPCLKGDGAVAGTGKAIVGSVLGDVHDIGKNLVCVMLEGCGLEVVNLGSDVTPEAFMGALDENPDASYVALSSTMTPTRVAMKDTTSMIRASDHRDVIVMVGGATMDQLFCDEIDADIYTVDAATASDRVKEIVSGIDRETVFAKSREIGLALLAPTEASVETVTEAASDARHLMEAPIRNRVGHGETKPLSVKENLAETLKHEKGCPDRYVNQYEFFDRIADPIYAYANGAGNTKFDEEYLDGWGVTHFFPKGDFDHPVNGPGRAVISDITKWQDVVKAPPLDFDEKAWAPVKEQMAKAEAAGRYGGIWIWTGIFERINALMGMQSALVAYYENPEEMHELVDFISDWELQAMERMMENLDAKMIFSHDDWGTAINSFLDPDTHRSYYEKPFKKLYTRFKELGGELVVHHDDAYSANLVDIMIDVGVDVWQGPVYANNLPDLIDRYGDRIVFMGGLDNGAIDIPGWTEQAVEEYVRRVCDENGVVSYIPCLTRGRGASVIPGVYDKVSQVIDSISKEKFRD